ncbi:MmcQ/YjbR family DNA-binding protein [Nocardiopsis sp. NPDC058631]|uniref:MmcQ/YjbR family DNA-binding protein n=1 Tax=Nocardiopsis sp. NPDC058631 TaxID=3346566 RepID=UPI0036543CDB
MTPQQFIDAALELPETDECEPFGPGAPVYRVAGQHMFAVLMGGADQGGDDDVPATVNLKCDPGLALELRKQYPAVTPGYHMSKRHWNSVLLDGTVPDDEIAEMLRHSYVLVASNLRRVDRDRVLAKLGEEPPDAGGAGTAAPEKA